MSTDYRIQGLIEKFGLLGTLRELEFYCHKQAIQNNSKEWAIYALILMDAKRKVFFGKE